MSPLARAVRTFAAMMVGVLGSVVVAVQVADYHAGITVLTLGVATAALGAVVAGALAWKDITASTPAGKAFATFLQFIAAGFATVTFATIADIVSFGHVAIPVFVAAVVAAVQTYAQNVAEASTA